MIPAWHPHYDVWAFVLVVGYGYLHTIRRIGPALGVPKPRVTGKQVALFFSGLVSLWVVSDWPFHDIAEQRLFLFHMIEHMTLALVSAPLMIAGTPAWVLQRIFNHPSIFPALRPLTRPLAAFFIFNGIMVGIHWPAIVDLMVTSGIYHFAVHALLLAAAIVMWIPVLSPVPEIKRLDPPLRMLYLFSHSLLPTVPASFLTFGREPLYRFYAEAPRLWWLDAITDQTLAGLVMKLGGGAILWGVLVVTWFRWYSYEQRWEALERELRKE
ncbi:MAG: cytochrome c oxidase assembly protein [Acidimicrobiia bacterium]|nr:cytochrome c oxidase assembly protein [Acidimicrobiia bacterium]MYF26595.1 cytochrome c oxidase assembly protein [Acidimicrobiia bacterium]